MNRSWNRSEVKLTYHKTEEDRTKQNRNELIRIMNNNTEVKWSEEMNWTEAKLSDKQFKTK